MDGITFKGRVVQGEGMATKLGCPTANIRIEEGAIIPALGVYVGSASVDGKEHPALVCINDGRTGYNLKHEVHLLDESRIDLVGKWLEVMLLYRIRDLVPYPGDEKMTTMIQEDIKEAQKWFQNTSGLLAG